MATEISYYNVCHVSVAEHCEFILVVWWLVYRMHNYSRHHYHNYFSSSLYSFINVRIALQYILLGGSPTSDMPAILDIERFVSPVYWKHMH